MGKNTRRQFQHHDDFHDIDVSVDSYEEYDFMNWCSEAAQLGIIIDFEYQPKSFILSEPIFYTNTDGKKRSLFRIHQYSPDFKITLNPNASKSLQDAFKVQIEQLQHNTIDVFIDVKGEFQRNGSGRAFSINQKWVYAKFGIYILKLVPNEFFKTCGCPAKSLKSQKTNKIRSIFKGYPSLTQCLLHA